MLSNTSRARRTSRASRSGPNTVPVDFNAAEHPILAAHWFGLAPLRPIGQITVEAPGSLRRHRQFEHVHRLGPRAVEELAVEVANGADLGRALEAYQRLTPELLETTGGHRVPPAPIHVVRQS